MANSTYGLDKIKSAIDTVDEVVDTINTNTDSIKTTVESSNTTLSTINTNAGRLTSARATKIDNIGATGDTGGTTSAGTVMGKLNALLTNMATVDTVADNIYTKVDTEVAAIKTKTDTIGATGDTGGSATAGTVMGKLNGIFTNAATAVSNTKANSTASKTGTLSQKDAYIISLLENTTYGLSALKTALGSSGSGGINLKTGYITGKAVEVACGSGYYEFTVPSGVGWVSTKSILYSVGGSSYYMGFKSNSSSTTLQLEVGCGSTLYYALFY